MANVTELKPVIEKLGLIAERELAPLKMRRFNGAGIRCPWLEWSVQRPPPVTPPEIEGLFLMQDWGNQDETIKNAIDYIELALRDPSARDDQTLRNLFKEEKWRKPIEEQSWLVSNAVWGLRDKKKCGYLGDSIHQAAFPIWMKLVWHLSSAAKNGSFKLVVAGEWAVFDEEFEENDEGSLELSDYLKKWVEFTYKGRPEKQAQLDLANECKGRVYHVWHPATWGWTTKGQDLRKGPP